MGPLTSAGHRDRVLSYVEVAQAAGRHDSDRRQGARTTPNCAAGCYVEPTVVDAQARAIASARKRSSARSSRVTRFKDDAEALEIANSTDVRPRRRAVDQQPAARAPRARGRSAPAWSGSTATSAFNPGSPFGGVGESGYGREMGFEAMHEYTEAKSVWVNVDAQIPPFYKR